MKKIVLLFHPDIQNARINRRYIQEIDSSITVHHVDEVQRVEEINIAQK